MATPAREIHAQPDWLIFQRFFEAVGGVGGYLLLRENSPNLCQEMMEAFGVTVEDLPKKEIA